jgi:hypothetical protein
MMKSFQVSGAGILPVTDAYRCTLGKLELQKKDFASQKTKNG